jgi:hypothetical protein
MKWMSENRPRVNVASLVVSLALNIALGAWLVFSLERPATAPNTGSAPPPPELPSLRKPVHRIVQVTNLPPTVDFNWSLVESADYREYIANLRAIQCPERVIRDIIFADLNRLYGARADSARKRTGPPPYWQDPANQRWVAVPSQIKAAVEEERAVWLDLFAEEPALSRELSVLTLRADERELHLAFLPAEKRELANRALAPYAEREAELRALLPERSSQFRRSLAQLDAERRQALLAVLTPTEADEYFLRTAEVARELRMQLLAVELTPAEFKAVVSARQRVESEPSRSAVAGRTEPGEEQLLTEALGSQRMAQFQRGTNLAFAAAWRIAEREGRPADTAAEVLQIKRTAEAAADSVRTTPHVAARERQALLHTIRQEAERSIRQALGDAGFDAYRRTGGGWLVALSR